MSGNTMARRRLMTRRGKTLDFSLLGFGAAAAAPWLSRPATWRVVDGLVALLMASLGLQLLLQPL